MTSRIIGTGHCVPDTVITNDALSKVVDTSDEWIRSRTGIGCRRVVKEETTSYMAYMAAKKALISANIEAEDIDLIIVATSTPDTIFPNTATCVQKLLNNKKAVCFDLNAACSGFVYALNVAHSHIVAGLAKKVLVIGSESMSKVIDWKDRGTCVLFGDGAGATVVVEDNSGFLHTVVGSDGSKGDAIICDGHSSNSFYENKEKEHPFTQMNGQDVFTFAVKKVPEIITQVLQEKDINAEDIHWYILHQANERIINSVAKRLKVPMEKFPMNLEHYGNTSAASIPILLDEMNQKGMLKKGQKIIISGFGAGLTWGATLLTW